MLAFTPEVEAWLEEFDLTYEREVRQEWIRWRRTTLPAAGGVQDQPAKALQRLTFIAGQKNGLLLREHARRSRRTTRE